MYVVIVVLRAIGIFFFGEMYRTVRENLYSCTGLNSLIGFNSSFRFW